MTENQHKPLEILWPAVSTAQIQLYLIASWREAQQSFAALSADVYIQSFG